MSKTISKQEHIKKYRLLSAASAAVIAISIGLSATGYIKNKEFDKNMVEAKVAVYEMVQNDESESKSRDNVLTTFKTLGVNNANNFQLVNYLNGINAKNYIYSLAKDDPKLTEQIDLIFEKTSDHKTGLPFSLIGSCGLLSSFYLVSKSFSYRRKYLTKTSNAKNGNRTLANNYEFNKECNIKMGQTYAFKAEQADEEEQEK